MQARYALQNSQSSTKSAKTSDKNFQAIIEQNLEGFVKYVYPINFYTLYSVMSAKFNILFVLISCS